MNNKLLHIISGGQTGVDQMALEAAHTHGLVTGGMAPKGFKTENGGDPTLARFGLTEHTSYDYPPRTRYNVNNSDYTVIFTECMSVQLSQLGIGTRLTVSACRSAGKSWTINPSATDLLDILHNPENNTVNFAGTRGSRLSESRRITIDATLFTAFAGVVN
jgi:hypothetical protein